MNLYLFSKPNKNIEIPKKEMDIEDDIYTTFGKIKAKQWEDDVKNDPFGSLWMIIPFFALAILFPIFLAIGIFL